ncbi:MAG: polysaccharide deacetylase family protein [Defluviitaleaceae bacterium]|nr:polysaccharide deacetylase family protein [Defluviitaleaceae bacterium]
MKKIMLICAFLLLAAFSRRLPIIVAAAEAKPELDTQALTYQGKEVQLPIIMYHLITERPKFIGKFGISSAQFREDLQYLRDNDYNTIVMQDLISFVNYQGELPENPIMLTFDDGNFSDYEYLFPLLQEFEMKAVIAIIGEATDSATKEQEANPRVRSGNLTWSQVAEMHESGYIEVQNHSHNLHKPPIGSGKKRGEPTETYHTRLYADLSCLQESCSLKINHTPTVFVYPLGVIAEDSRKVCEELGMVGSLSCLEGMNTIKQGDADCLFRLRRVNRSSKCGIKQILDKL